MSKELADRLDLEPDEEALERFDELLAESPDVEDPDRLDERIEAAREGHYVPKRAESWEALWEDYR